MNRPESTVSAARGGGAQKGAAAQEIADGQVLQAPPLSEETQRADVQTATEPGAPPRADELPDRQPYDAPQRPVRIETWLWLANALGPASAQAAEVLLQYPDPEVLVHERFSVDLQNIFTQGQLTALRDKEPEDFVARRARCEALGVHIVPYDSVDYPVLLRHTDAPPPVLFYRGDITIANRCLTFAMVGTRRPSAYGVEATRALAQELAKAGVVLVSGLAAGLDSESHKAAVQNGTPTIACIAFGHDTCYPAENRQLKELIEQQGLVIGEYPPGTRQQKPFFLQRNRLIAGLSYGLCVAEARERSGTMNTVDAALRYGRDVFSVPGSIFSPLCEGTNALLKEGAMPVTSALDILHWYRRDAGEDAQEQFEQPDIDLSPDAGLVYAALSCKPQPLDVLCEKTHLPSHKVMAALTELELAGISAQQAGRQFVLVQ
ncbi:MAG: DNA-processing protein DprA [Ruthenibacterium sp.]